MTVRPARRIIFTSAGSLAYLNRLPTGKPRPPDQESRVEWKAEAPVSVADDRKDEQHESSNLLENDSDGGCRWRARTRSGVGGTGPQAQDWDHRTHLQRDTGGARESRRGAQAHVRARIPLVRNVGIGARASRQSWHPERDDPEVRDSPAVRLHGGERPRSVETQGEHRAGGAMGSGAQEARWHVRRHQRRWCQA